MKKKYFVSPKLPIYIISLSLVEMIAIILCVTLMHIKEEQQLIVNFVIIFAVVCPTLQSFATICIMWAKIGIDEKGVTKYLFGKKIKFFSWDDIREIKGLNNKNEYWIVFCNKIVSDEKLYFCNRKSYTIPILKRQEIVELIMQYCPNEYKKESCSE